ncbi:N-acetylmuramoyl-L-alanine amidase [Lactiplantibacillus mudanjiangensis]|uniref:N-acetylmuramoyl-L-alanine amidase n=2 Tax=Lactiplantibacillus mudanjiangensis TaxID=1296538 RepID=A0A660DV55_9LACO|nr:N-acetylmuramoyl-L-alanine amidase [Lactiplantibacillus mudanjiangensis]VDG23611.1 hypothetical protein MUDAN_IGPPGNFN_02157 [Lactiplantibacillus mudanjiangensis]VDG27051.1 hypothetical protein MUDAN_MDHGFNIF_00418 [Lactiplantibacillus mudanjiangensis]
MKHSINRHRHWVAGLGMVTMGVLLTAGSMTLIQPSVPAAAATSTVTVNAKTAGLVGNNDAIDNVKNLQAIIDAHTNAPLVINVPKGDYHFGSDTGTEIVTLHSNITFNFEDGANFIVDNARRVNFVYPSPKAGYDGGISNITWKNATFKGSQTSAGQSIFTQSVHHASAVTFDGCTFDNAESPTGHYIDLDGSHNITITNSTFTGFNGTDKQYKEAIQIDYSNAKAMSYKSAGDQYDNLPTYDVHVTNNKFLPVQKTSGYVQSFAPNPIGQHALYNHGAAGIIHDVYFENNYVQDVRPLLTADDANIHFRDVSNLYIQNNQFVNKYALGSGNYIRLYNTEKTITMDNLNIKNNTFSNLSPDNRYVYLDAATGTKMTNITITGNTIQTSKSSVPFVTANFDTTDAKISNNNSKALPTTQVEEVPTGTQITDSGKLTISMPTKKRKATNKVESYFHGTQVQTAKVSAKAVSKKYALYNHVKGHKNWNYVVPDWKKLGSTIYVDKYAKASSGQWYRIAFSSDSKATHYWIRIGGVSASAKKKNNLQSLSSWSTKKNKQTNKTQTYRAGLNTQHAELATNLQAKKFALYNHIKGAANWKTTKVDWTKLGYTRAYIDMKAEADSGTWYRIRFTTAKDATKFWIRKSGLVFDKITYEDYSKTLNLIKRYPVYDKVFDAEDLAKDKGTTGDVSQMNVKIVQRARRTDSKGAVTTYYQMENGNWTRASAFDIN